VTNPEFLATITRSVDLRVAGDLASAAQLATLACDARPDEPSAWHTLAMVSSDLGKHAEALYCRARAVSLLEVLAIHTKILDEQFQYVQQCVFGYATSLLLAGEWETAWPLWEIGRLGYSWSPPQGTVYWQGQTDGNLLVVCEGGYGDLFMFSRFLPMLRKRLADGAVLEGGPIIGLIVFKGLRAFRDWRALGVDFVYEVGDDLPLGIWKYSTSIMSLPAMLGVNSTADVPSDSLAGTYGASPSGTVGFCWHSEENQTKRRFRSIPHDAAEAIALDLPRYSGGVVSLCPSGKGLATTSKCPQLFSVRANDARMKTWNDTAIYIAGMRMVVTVDTAVAHLAGLLGVPTLLLLPLNVDWKWGLTSDRTPWYSSVRLFRNQHPLEWERDRIVKTALDMYQEISR
jgi:hypothetical protein